MKTGCILVVCPKEQIDHLIGDKLSGKPEDFAWWDTSKHPKNLQPEDLIFFQVDGSIVGYAKVDEVSRHEDGWTQIIWRCDKTLVLDNPVKLRDNEIVRMGWRYVDSELIDRVVVENDFKKTVKN